MKKTKILFLLAKALLLSGAWISVSPMIIPDIVKRYQEPGVLEDYLLTILRDRNSSRKEFCEATDLLIPFLISRVAENLSFNKVGVWTPLMQCDGIALKKKIVLVPIMRSGNTLVEGFREYFKDSSVGFILIQRDEETAQAKLQYHKLPKNMRGNKIVILEPMIATGGTLTIAINLLIAQEIEQEDIIITSIIAAPEGLHYLQEQFPNISVVVLKIDKQLDDKKYILPGLGDFGDRYYGTEPKKLQFLGGE